jgi:hypothetical protein
MILSGTENIRSTAMHVEQSGTVWFHIAQYRVVGNTVLCRSVSGSRGKLLTSCGFFVTIIVTQICLSAVLKALMNAAWTHVTFQKP